VITENTSDSNTFINVQDDIRKGNNVDIAEHVNSLLKSNVLAEDILQIGMIPVMGEIGEKFKTNEVFIPEVLLSARAMNMGMEILEPYFVNKDKENKGKVLICTVKGDHHDIGKNLVAIMLRGVGYDVKDIGINVSKEDIVKTINTYKPDVLGLSALLTTTMPEMKNVINALIEANVRERIKVMVGGAPVNEKYAIDIGADGYGADGGDAVSLVEKFMKE